MWTRDEPTTEITLANFAKNILLWQVKEIETQTFVAGMWKHIIQTQSF